MQQWAPEHSGFQEALRTVAIMPDFFGVDSTKATDDVRSTSRQYLKTIPCFIKSTTPGIMLFCSSMAIRILSGYCRDESKVGEYLYCYRALKCTRSAFLCEPVNKANNNKGRFDRLYRGIESMQRKSLGQQAARAHLITRHYLFR
jgi:hypothetical protein